MESSEKSVILRHIILNTRYPIIFRKFTLNWTCVQCQLDEWCSKYDAAIGSKTKSCFDQMPTTFGDFPQWERYRSKIELTFSDFLQIQSENSNKWTAFNYEPVNKMPKSCCYDVDFGCFGFSKCTNDASFWLSSKGANTPCHYDTYGCNIVVQIYGRKQWLLFPPETGLTPTRVPYEESSVYCSENFFSPKNLDQFSGARNNAFECILEEGDVLIVPRNWWHYVESLDTSLSINTWIPLEIDIDAQIEECIVKYIVEKSVSEESVEKKRYILNPNQLELINSSEELLKILRVLTENKLKKSSQSIESFPYEYLKEEDFNRLIESCPVEVTPVKPLQPSEFDRLVREKTKRYKDIRPHDILTKDPVQELLLNAICHPNVIKAIKKEFLKKASLNIEQ